MLPKIFRHYRYIKTIPIFQEMNWLDMQRVAYCADIRHVPKGAVIYHRGDPADGFYCLVSGRMRAYVLNEAGEKTDVEFFHKGMYFGIVSLLTGESHSMTFEALNDSTIIFFPKDIFQDILKKFPQLGLQFSKSLSRRIHRRSEGKGAEHQRRLISVYSPIKKSGSSTYAFNLAFQLKKETQRKIICIHFFSVKELSDEDNAVALDQLMQEPETVAAHVIDASGGFSLLGVYCRDEDDHLELRISEFITSFVLDYNDIIVDLPNHMDNVVLETLVQSDQTHLICRNYEQEVEGISRVITLLENRLKGKFDPAQIKVILNDIEDIPPLSLEHANQILGYDVYARLPHLSQGVQPAARLPVLSDLKADYSKVVRRIARDVGGVRVGLVLGGGAALGVAHIGVLSVLERENIPIDIVAGSSMGALVGALWTTSYDAACLENIARQFKDQKTMLKLFDPVIPISGVIGGRLIKRWLYRFLGDKHFYDTKIPLCIVAYDLLNREEMVFKTGPLVETVRKSISIPGVFEPIVEQERVIIDGGVLNPVPVNVLRDCGVDKIVAVNVLQSPDEVVMGLASLKKSLKDEKDKPFHKSPIAFFKKKVARKFQKSMKPTISDIMVKTLLATEYEISLHSAKRADVIIHPDLSGVQWYELYKVEELLAAGKGAAERALPQIRALLNKTNGDL